MTYKNILRHKDRDGIWKDVKDVNDGWEEEKYEYDERQEFKLRYSDCVNRLDPDTADLAHFFMIKVLNEELTLDDDLETYIELNVSKRKSFFREYVNLLFYKIKNEIVD